MKQEKIDRAVASLTSVAAKVYDCVPATEVWETKYICGELTRKGQQLSPKMIMGCLNSLKQDGLIKEPSKGHWIQVKAQGSRRHMQVVPVVEDASEEELEQHFDDGSMTAHTRQKLAEEGTLAKEPRDPMLILMEFTDKMTQLRKEFDDAADEITRYFEKMKEEAQEAQDLIELFDKLMKRNRD